MRHEQHSSPPRPAACEAAVGVLLENAQAGVADARSAWMLLRALERRRAEDAMRRRVAPAPSWRAVHPMWSSRWRSPSMHLSDEDARLRPMSAHPALHRVRHDVASVDD